MRLPPSSFPAASLFLMRWAFIILLQHHKGEEASVLRPSGGSPIVCTRDDDDDAFASVCNAFLSLQMEGLSHVYLCLLLVVLGILQTSRGTLATSSKTAQPRQGNGVFQKGRPTSQRAVVWRDRRPRFLVYSLSLYSVTSAPASLCKYTIYPGLASSTLAWPGSPARPIR